MENRFKTIVLNFVSLSNFSEEQDNVKVNTGSAIAYSEVRITEISEQLSRVDPSD